MTPALIHALNHPVRRQILRSLSERGVERSSRELAETVAIGLTSLSFHSRALYLQEVTRLTKTRKVRGATEKFYASNVTDNELVTLILEDTEKDDGLLFETERRKK